MRASSREKAERAAVVATDDENAVAQATASLPGSQGATNSAVGGELVEFLVLDRGLHCRLAQRAASARQAEPFDDFFAAGKHLRDMVGADFLAILEPHLQAALSGRPAVTEIQSFPGLAAGSVARVVCTPQFDADGDVQGVQILLFDITTQRRAEAQVELRERQFDEAQRLGNLGYWQRDLAADELVGSEGYFRIIARQAGSAVPFDNYIEMIHPEDREWANRNRERASAETRGYDYAYRLIRPNGEVRWVEGVTEPILDEGSEITGFFGVMRDVTDRRNVEARLKLRERQLDEAQRLGHIGHWHWDVANNQFEASDELYRIYGIDPAVALTLQRITEPIHPDDRQWTRENRERARAERRGYDFAFRILRTDGEVRWLEGRTEPVLDTDGEVAGYFGVTQDVTDRKQVELANARYLNAIEQLQEGIALYDENDKLVVCNSAYRKVPGRDDIELEPGITFEEVARRRRVAAFGPEDPEKLDVYIAERMKKRRNPTGPLVFRFGDTWQQVAEERLADGGTIMIVTEITAQRKFEEQLRQAKHAEALGRVAGGIAHEFNNVLTVINASLELLKRKSAGDERLERVAERAGNALRRGVGLSQRMLAYGRQQFLRPVDMDLNAFIREQVADLEGTIGAHIEIEPRLPAMPALCWADPEALEAAFICLVENARDAMAGGGRLVISTESVSRVPNASDTDAKPRDYMMLELSDSGLGMSPETLEHACDPFFTTKDVGEGAGLGLSMVQGFVHQSGGDLTIESAPGKGTAVRIYLPHPEGRDPMSPVGKDR